MSLRDWFAGQVLNRAADSVMLVFEKEEDGRDVTSVVATRAYAIADAMIAEKHHRDKGDKR
jgi:hypothetical protein